MLHGLRGRSLSHGRDTSFHSSLEAGPEIWEHSPAPFSCSPPVLMAYPSSTGAQRVLFASDEYDSYATYAAGPDLSLAWKLLLVLWEAGDPLCSGLFHALPRSYRGMIRKECRTRTDHYPS
jgi:hypothetical protein